MSELKPVGTIYKDERNREVYLVLEDDKEAYFFKQGSFYQGLTRFADKGCNLKDIEEKMPQLPEYIGA